MARLGDFLITLGQRICTHSTGWQRQTGRRVTGYLWWSAADLPYPVYGQWRCVNCAARRWNP